MAALKMTVHGIESGTCSLSGKDAECIRISMEDGTVQNTSLSFKAFASLLRMKFSQDARPQARPQALPAAIAMPAVGQVK